MKTVLHAAILTLGVLALMAAWLGYQGALLGVLLALTFCQ
jgi:hypothetical protein